MLIEINGEIAACFILADLAFPPGVTSFNLDEGVLIKKEEIAAQAFPNLDKNCHRLLAIVSAARGFLDERAEAAVAAVLALQKLSPAPDSPPEIDEVQAAVDAANYAPPDPAPAAAEHDQYENET